MAETIAVLAERADRTRVNSRVVKSKFSTEYFAKMAHLLLVVRDWLRHDYSAVLINQVQVIYFYGLVVIVLLCNAIVLSSAFVISSAPCPTHKVSRSQRAAKCNKGGQRLRFVPTKTLSGQVDQQRSLPIQM